jgi:hypothetical protein
LPQTCAPVPVGDRLIDLASVRDVVRELQTLSKQQMAARSSRPSPIFVEGDLVFLSSKGLHIHSQKYKHLRDQRLGPFEVVEKVGFKSCKIKLRLLDIDFIVSSILIFYLGHHVLHLCVTNPLELKVTSMSMRLTISQTRKFIFGSIYVVLIFNS